jgi:hypothetical protein
VLNPLSSWHNIFIFSVFAQTWVMQYAGAGQAVAAGAPYYQPTRNDKETVADGSAVPVPIEDYANA